jgi:hypothetical protein
MEGVFQFFSSNGRQARILLAPVRQWAARLGLIHTPALLDELPPGVYTWVLTLEGLQESEFPEFVEAYRALNGTP